MAGLPKHVPPKLAEIVHRSLREDPLQRLDPDALIARLDTLGANSPRPRGAVWKRLGMVAACTALAGIGWTQLAWVQPPHQIPETDPEVVLSTVIPRSVEQSPPVQPMVVAEPARREVKRRKRTAIPQVAAKPSAPPASEPVGLVQLLAVKQRRWQKGLLYDDVPGLRDAFARAEASAVAQPADLALTTALIDEAAARLDAVAVDQPFIERKLERLRANSRHTPVDGASYLDKALRAALDGRFEDANRTLNELDALLRRTR